MVPFWGGKGEFHISVKFLININYLLEKKIVPDYTVQKTKVAYVF